MTASRESSGCAPACKTEYEVDTDRSLAVTVSEALAAAEGTEPWEMDPLYDVIDFDAVEQLFQDETPGAMTLTFGVDEWNVHVHGDGTIEVYEAVRPADPSPSVESVVGD